MTEVFQSNGYLNGERTLRDLNQITHNIMLAHAKLLIIFMIINLNYKSEVWKHIQKFIQQHLILMMKLLLNDLRNLPKII